MQITNGEDLHNIVLNAPIGICILDAATLTSEIVNDKFLEVAGKPHDVIAGKYYWDSFAEARPYYEAALNGVVEDGKPYYADEVELMLIRHGKEEMIFVTFVYSPIKNKKGKVTKVAVWVLENTLQVVARKKIEEAEQQARESLKTLRNMILHAPVAMCLLTGRDHTVEVANALMIEIWGKNEVAVTGKPVFEFLPEAKEQGFDQLLDKVYKTGKTFYANERPIELIRNGQIESLYLDFVYEAYKGVDGTVAGVFVVATDVTAQVVARRELEENTSELQAINEEIAATNEEMAATNEELAAVNEELATTNEELTQSQAMTARSEKLFRSIAVNIPNSVVIVIDKDHRYVLVEGDLMDRLGYDRRDYEGKHPTEIGQAERYLASKPLYDRMMAGEKFTVERKAATGENYIVHFVPLKNAHDEVDAGLVMAIDITDIKQAEEKSAKLGAIIESSDDAIISKTLESVITSWNDAAQRIFGYTAEEIIGETIYKLIPPDRQDEEPRILARLKGGERVEHFETKRMTKDGRLLDVSLTISPIKDKQGNIIGLSKIARDITERKLDEARKNDFIGMVSHELKTPLTSLTAIIQVANAKLKQSNDAFLTGALERANMQVKRMTAMINGFLNISRLEAGKIDIKKEPFDLYRLLQEIVDETRLILNTHTISLVESGPVEINADRDKISSVISNLISNAVKYSPNGKRIEIECRANANSVVVCVKDEGIGINSQDLDKIFDRYYRVETDDTQHISGFGIGLYLSAEIIKRHEGEIWAESESGKGSAFYFSLPIT